MIHGRSYFHGRGAFGRAGGHRARGIFNARQPLFERIQPAEQLARATRQVGAVGRHALNRHALNHADAGAENDPAADRSRQNVDQFGHAVIQDYEKKTLSG
jgi:hypothetical protein